jgi:phospholipase C
MAPPVTPSSALDPIKHVIVLMLENRSFDHALGCMRGLYPALDGIPPAGGPRTNLDLTGTPYPQAPGAARQVTNDPDHDTPAVIEQIAGGMAGFVTNYQHNFPNAPGTAIAEVMKYHARGSLPALHALAENFLVCDHWFSSLPGPTWPNRIFVHSGTSLGKVTMPDSVISLNYHWYDQTTLYDQLNAAKISWQIYHGDMPQSLILTHQLEPENAARYRKFQYFSGDVAGAEASFPQYCFIEPSYSMPGANDDHPPHDIMDGERLIADVYNAIRANEALWTSTLLVVLYDEHGGFYDHVVPPKTVPPDNHQDEYTFDQLGVRVPAILVSPYVASGVLSTVFDHTSLLRYLTDKWKLGPLGARTAQANSFASALSATVRADCPTSVPALPPAGLAPAGVVSSPPVLSEQQQALLGLSHVLETMADTEPATIAARSRQLLTGPQSQIDVAMDRVDDFLTQARAKAKTTASQD